MSKSLTALFISFILLSSILTIGVFSKTYSLPVLAKKNSSDSSNSNNATTTTSSSSAPHATPHKKHANPGNTTSPNNATATTITTTTNKTPTKNATIITSSNATQATTTNATQPLSCFSKDLLKCYWKMIFQITPAPADKFSNFIIHITDNPRLIADFPAVGKSTLRYLLPGDYRVSFIYKGINQGLYCAGAAPIGVTRTCNFLSPSLTPPPPSGPGTLLVSEAIRFVNGSFPTKPPVTTGTITVKGNNPNPAHLQVYDGDDEEGREVTLGPGKYAATISLPNDYKLTGTDGACSGIMTKGGQDFCHFNVQLTGVKNTTKTTTGKPHPKITIHEVTRVQNSIRNFIMTNPAIIQPMQKQQQLPNFSLIQLDTMQLCQQLGNQTCISTQKNFKVLFANTTKDAFGDWVLFGKVQNNSSMPLSQVRITMYLYNSTGNIVGLKQGSTAPQNLNPMQNAIFFLQERQSDSMNIPKFFRISFDSQR
jgi:hypothetical protein